MTEVQKLKKRISENKKVESRKSMILMEGRVINGNSPTAKVKGWDAEMIESDEILSYYIDPSQEKIMKHKKED